MILVDFSQVIISNVMQSLNQIPDPNEDYIRHMILNSLRFYKQKFSKKYGDEIVLCCDGRKYWRRDIFEHYKYSRKKGRDESKLDWNEIFGMLDKIRNELIEHSPYKVILLNEAEADDIIGVYAKAFGNDVPVMIVSGDSDFPQLQRYRYVAQYSPVLKKMITESDPLGALQTKIIKGDKKDGIPNIMSPDNSFVTGVRQKSIQAKKLDKWLGQAPESFCDDFMLFRYKLNEKLIDLSLTPRDINDKILVLYENKPLGTKRSLLSYFMKNGMKQSIKRIEEF